MTITEPAWAKLNLTLDILGKRLGRGKQNDAEGGAVS